MPIFRQLRFAFSGGPPASAPGLTDDDRETMRVLDRLAGKNPEVWHSVRTIAAKLGIGVRAVQVRLKRLVDFGLLRRVLDYGLRTRRRLALLWRLPGGSFCAQGRPDFAPTTGVPLEPPIEVRDSQNTRDDDDKVKGEEEARPIAEVLTGLGVPPEAIHAPEGPRSVGDALGSSSSSRLPQGAPEPEPRRGPAPERGPERKAYFQATVDKAKRILPHEWWLEDKVRKLATRRLPDGSFVGLLAVSLALDWAERYKARTWAFVLKVALGQAEEGRLGPPPPAKQPTQQNYNPRPPAATEPEAPLSPEEIEFLRRQAAGPEHLGATRLARQALAGAGLEVAP